MFGKFFDEITKPSQKLLQGAGNQLTGDLQKGFTDLTKAGTQAATKYAEQAMAKYIEKEGASLVGSFMSTEAAPVAESAATDI